MAVNLLTGKQDGHDLSLHIDLDDSVALEDVVPVALDAVAHVAGPAGLALHTMAEVVRAKTWDL